MFSSGALGFTVSPALIVAAVLTLIPLVATAFFSGGVAAWVNGLRLPARLLCPAVLCVPYVLVTATLKAFRWEWFALYALLPVAIAGLLWQARQADRAQRGNWRDFLVLGALGLAVDLRWFERAWPAHLAVFNKMLLLDAGIYGFLVVRQLDGVGFDLRLRLRDCATGLRESGLPFVFVLFRQVEGVGFARPLRRGDGAPGLREFGWCAPIAIVLGL